MDWKMFKMYADDSKVISEVGEEAQDSKLQRDIVKIKEWCDKSMCLNASKCKIILLVKKIPAESTTLRIELN